MSKDPKITALRLAVDSFRGSSYLVTTAAIVERAVQFEQYLEGGS